MKYELSRPRAVSIAVVLGSFFFLASRSSQAQQATFDLDPAKTTVTFTLGDVLHTVHGTFKAKTGHVTFDLASGAASGDFVIDATSGDSGNHTRDHKMHKEILESDKYPEIAFNPTKIVGKVATAGTSTVQVEGKFRIHGSEHAMTLSVPVKVSGSALNATLHFAVPYVDWGLKDPSNFVLRVSKEVEIDIFASGRYTAAP
jgi:polyisoprenoid-binding protein YceI